MMITRNKLINNDEEYEKQHSKHKRDTQIHVKYTRRPTKRHKIKQDTRSNKENKSETTSQCLACKKKKTAECVGCGLK